MLLNDANPELMNAYRAVKSDVNGLFVAPKIDFNTAHTFRVATWYDRNGEETLLKIVPVNLEIYTRMIESILSKRRTPTELKELLDECLTTRDMKLKQWLADIETKATAWIGEYSLMLS